MTASLLAETPARHGVLDDELATAWGMIIGERPVPSAAELKFIDRAANSPSSSFSYGESFTDWDTEIGLRGQEGYTYGTIGAERIHGFYAESINLDTQSESQVWGPRAAVATEAILSVVNSPDDTEALALQVPFDEWDRDKTVLPVFAGWIRQMVDAYDAPDGEQAHLVRDDSRDANAAQLGKHGTKMWVGSGRARGVIVVDESAIRVDEHGNRRLVREMWIAKRQTKEEALRLRNRHGLIPRERISRLLNEHPQPATPAEKEHILWYADRSQIRNDKDAIASLDWYRGTRRATPLQLLRWRALGVLMGLKDIFWQKKQTGAEDEAFT